MPGVDVSCPHCGAHYAVAADKLGRQVRCKACSQPFVLETAAVDTPEEPADPFADLQHLEAPAAQAAGPRVAPPRREQSRAPTPPMTAAPAMAPAWQGASTSAPRRQPRWLAASALIAVSLLALTIYGSLRQVDLELEQSADVLETYPQASRDAMVSVIRTAAWKHIGIVIGSVAGVLAPLCLLGVFLAATLLKFRLPDSAYLRALGIAALPLCALWIANIATTGAPTRSPAQSLGLLAPLAALVLTFFLLRETFGTHFGETALAYAFAAVLGAIGFFGQYRVVQSMRASVADQITRIADKAKADVQREALAARDARREKIRSEMEAAGLSSKPRNAAPSAPPRDPAETRAVALLDRARALAEGSNTARSRESARKALDAIRAEAEGAKATIADRPEWGALQTQIAEAERRLPEFESEEPPAALFAPPPAEPTWPAATTDASLLAEAVSFDRFDIRPPAPLKLDLRQPDPTKLTWKSAGVFPTTLTLSVQPRQNTQQQVPWVHNSRFITDHAKRDRLLLVDEKPESVRIAYGRLGGLPTTQVVKESERPDAKGGRGAKIRYFMPDGDRWIVAELLVNAAELRPALVASAESLNVRSAGRAAIDPKSPERVISLIADDREAASAVLARNRAVAEPLLVGQLDATDRAMRRAAASLLQTFATAKSLPRLRALVADADSEVAASARAIVRRLDPSSFDSMDELLVDLKSADTFKRSDAMERLAKTPPVEKHRNAVAAILESYVLPERAFGPDANIAAKALAVWQGDQTASRIAPLLNNAKLWRPRREVLITALAGSKDKSAPVTLIKWLAQDTEQVSSALVKMGSIAEAEVVRVLGTYFTNRTDEGSKVRAACVQILKEIGTPRSLDVLGRAARDNRDPVSQATAKEAIDRIRAKPPAPAATRPTTAPVPARATKSAPPVVK